MTYQLAIWAMVITFIVMAGTCLALSKFLDWLAISLDERARRIKGEELNAHRITPQFNAMGDWK